jgi:N-acetylmuramoyl-L-alanine amidase
VPFHEVKPGETLMALAAKNGLQSWEDILDAPENAALKSKRPDPGILKPGDSVFIPSRVMKQQASAVDAQHPFKISRPTAWLRLAIKDAAGVALANKKYELSVDSIPTTGTIPADGIIERAVSVHAAEGTLTVWLDEQTKEVWSLRIGHMDPIDEESGVVSRLANLGFDCGDLASSVRAFQERVGLEVTGTVDDALRDKLKAYYDPAQDETGQESA